MQKSLGYDTGSDVYLGLWQRADGVGKGEHYE